MGNIITVIGNIIPAFQQTCSSENLGRPYVMQILRKITSSSAVNCELGLRPICMTSTEFNPIFVCLQRHTCMIENKFIAVSKWHKCHKIHGMLENG